MFPFVREFVLLFFLMFIWSSSSIEITIEQGILRGHELISRKGAEYYEFAGIPFAKPPVGDLRFEPPQPPERWNGVRNATVDPLGCIQSGEEGDGSTWGQEDCLYLNVHVPKKKTQLLPVMVYIHGGGYSDEYIAIYKPFYFMDHNVIVVTIQYRLGILGFLSTGDEVLPGNNGMKDQVMALKWVQKNIASFGGNPKEVTIFGESAGGSCVHHHLYSSLSKGLFHRAIIQSGTGLAPWAHTSSKIARKAAQAVGIISWCPSENSKDLIDCLKKLPADEFVRAQDKFYIVHFYPPSPFSIVSEPSTVKGAFITENPWYLNVTSNVPCIFGITSAEGIAHAIPFIKNNGTRVKYFNEHYKRMLPLAFSYGFYPGNIERIDEITESLKKFYFGDKPIGAETPKELVRVWCELCHEVINRSGALVQLFTDGWFAYNSLEAARRYNGPFYFYCYDHRNNKTEAWFFGEYFEDLGASHADDLTSLFYMDDTGVSPELTEKNGDDYKVSEKMVKYWVNFATNGNPNNGDEVWTPVQSDAIEYLHITSKKDDMKKDLFKERYLFWKNLRIIPPSEENHVSGI